MYFTHMRTVYKHINLHCTTSVDYVMLTISVCRCMFQVNWPFGSGEAKN